MEGYGIINDRSPHIVADLCELVAYFEDIPVSRGDIEGFITARGGEGLLSALRGPSDTETNERIQSLTEDAFKHLMYRQTAFGGWYPFDVQHDVMELKPDQSDKHKIYAALLADSRLKMFSKADRSLLAAEFEKLCKVAMPGLFPNWNVYHFGVGGADRLHFGNRLRDALVALAKTLRDEVVQKRVDEIEDNNFGDAGIDLVAVYEWSRDPAEALPIYFCQCAAQQENWPLKRFEAHPISHERYFNFFHKPGSVLFIPLCYRGPDANWIDSDGHQCVLIDRLRLTELFDSQIDDNRITTADILSVIASPLSPGCFKVNHEQPEVAAA